MSQFLSCTNHDKTKSYEKCYKTNSQSSLVIGIRSHFYIYGFTKEKSDRGYVNIIKNERERERERERFTSRSRHCSQSNGSGSFSWRSTLVWTAWSVLSEWSLKNFLFREVLLSDSGDELILLLFTTNCVGAKESSGNSISHKVLFFINQYLYM